MPRSRKTETLKAKSPARPPSIRGEKRVRKTNAAVPIAPARRARGTHDGPTDPAAVDRRKEVTGTDELPKRARRTGGGGNANRPAIGLPRTS